MDGMKILDMRHRWDSQRVDGKVMHTCRVCHKTVVFDPLIPDMVIEMIVESLTASNPYGRLLS